MMFSVSRPARGAIAASMFVLAGCAQAPDSIQASYVDASPFARLTCPQLNAEARRAAGEYGIRARQQDQARTGDIVGVALVGLPMSSIVGADQSADISRLKGEQETIRQQMIAKRCTLA